MTLIEKAAKKSIYLQLINNPIEILDDLSFY
jgi:hypothetical protein